MLSKREIIAISPLPNCPGYWLLTGRTQGEFGTWHVIRKPNGSYWTAVTLIGSAEKIEVIEIGDKIADASAVTQFESGFVSLTQATAHSTSVSTNSNRAL
jgi:hypothetical protein